MRMGALRIAARAIATVRVPERIRKNGYKSLNLFMGIIFLLFTFYFLLLKQEPVFEESSGIVREQCQLQIIQSQF
jgi:hypothetical protein